MFDTPTQAPTQPAGPTPEAPPPRGGPVRDLIRLLRPYQWVKNTIMVPLPLLHPQIWTARGMLHLAAAVVVFTLASSVVYIANDITDRKRDRLHPGKRHRPLAAGRVSVSAAAFTGGAVAAALALLIVLVEPLLAVPVGAYLALNLAYCLGLKHVPVVEIFVVAAGFGLRLITGYVSVQLDTSWWPTLGVYLLATVVVLGKRRSELELTDPSHRPALRGYTKPLVDQLVLLSAGLGVTMLVFFLNTYEPPYGVWAAPVLLPLTLLGLYRYLQIVSTSGGDADPVRTLVRDRIIVATAVLSLLAWIVLQAVVHGTFGGVPDPVAGQGS
ncbi:UbiA prenyltransferase family protein [Streptomyces sp. NPDC059468]|uniref:UbiA prenyltransferase family protein n=1 Tax=unclassified Streptomyces TaxID=2593676 RepID=UPI0036A32268